MQNGKPLKISFKTVCNYLKEVYGKPKKIRKVFYLNESQKKKRLEFCRKILEREIEPKSIMFTDECKFDLILELKQEIGLGLFQNLKRN